MFHILGYGYNAAAGDTLVQMPALSDPSFVPQNENWIFYEDYELDAIYASGVSLTAAQLFDSTWNSLNVPQIYPVNLLLTPPSNPQVQDQRQYPIQIPQNEQIQAQVSNNLAEGNEYEFILMFISPNGQPRNIPTPASPYGNKGRIKALFTWTGALTAGAWSPDAPVTVPNLIRGGTYCVVGVNIVMANAVAVRFNFPRNGAMSPRKLYPGALVENAYGNIPLMKGAQWMGPFGYFDTTEYFQIAALGTAAEASATYTGYLDLVYMGQNLIGQGGMTP